MELSQLKYFQVVAKYENMTQAAKVLNVVQPAISRSIQRLEKDLGLQLFERRGKQIRLSEAGRYFYHEVNRSLKVLEDAVTYLKENQEGRVINLHLESGSEVMMRVLQDYTKSNPSQRIVITQGFVRGPYDLLITTLEEGADLSGAHLLIDEEVQLLVRRQEGIADLEEGDFLTILRQIEKEPFIGLTEAFGIRRMTDAYLRKHNLKLYYAFESDNPSLVRDMVHNGYGHVFFPTKTWGQYPVEHYHPISIKPQPLIRCLVLKEGPGGLEKESKALKAFILKWFEEGRD